MRQPKPIIYYVVAFLGGLIALAAAVGLLGQLFSFGGSLGRADAAGQFGLVLLTPVVVYYVIRFALVLAIFVWLVKKTRVWDRSAMLLGVLVVPFLLVSSSGMIYNKFVDNPSGALPGAPLAPILVTLFFWLAVGVATYYDLTYRQPMLINNGVKK